MTKEWAWRNRLEDYFQTDAAIVTKNENINIKTVNQVQNAIESSDNVGIIVEKFLNDVAINLILRNFLTVLTGIVISLKQSFN